MPKKFQNVFGLDSQPQAPRLAKGGFCPDMYLIMTLWIGNGAVLKRSSKWQLK